MMKKIASILMMVMFLASCGGAGEPTDADSPVGAGGQNTNGGDIGTNSGDDNSGDDSSGDDSSGDDSSGDDNSGDDNSGDDNSGNDNSGDDNSGNDNSGDDSSGDDNSGNDNSGGDLTGDLGSHPVGDGLDEDCGNDITPYHQVNGGKWLQSTSVRIDIGDTIRFGPQADQGSNSGWSWTGCGSSGSLREHTIAPTEDCTATVTHKHQCEASTTAESTTRLSFTIEVYNLELVCSAQAAQCGDVWETSGNIAFCGNCGAGETCFRNACEKIEQNEVPRECALQGAQCGTILSSSGESLYCGDPQEAHFCIDNRSEPSCDLDQIDDGKLNDFFAYLPLQVSDSDLSPNGFATEITRQPMEPRELFPFVSRTDLTAKQVDVDLAAKRLSPPLTVSFKFIPQTQTQEKLILQSDAFNVLQTNAGIATTFTSSGSPATIENTQSEVNLYSCNHYAVVADADGLSSWLNGNKNAIATDTSGVSALQDILTAGPWPGRLWDVRIFDKALSDEEVIDLGEDCADAKTMVSPYPEAPNYLCGVYACSWWRDGVTDTSEESFLYHIEKQNMLWEHNVISSLMYTKGEFCQIYATGREQMHLTDEFRKNINNENFSKPIKNYGLHETFHSYQSRFIENRTGKWFAEASAEWGAYTLKPGVSDHNLLGHYTLQPHQPLYARELKPEEWTVFTEYSGGHMYGSGIFLWYLTEFYFNPRFIGEVVRKQGHPNHPTISTVEMLYQQIAAAGLDMRDIFGEFAAKTITWDYTYGEGWRDAEDAARNRMEGVRENNDNAWPEEDVDNKITAHYAGEGTAGVYVSVPDRFRPGSWAYNAYQVSVDANANYRIGVRTAEDNASFAEFRGTVVVHSESSGKREYYPLNVGQPGEAVTIDVPASVADQIYLVVATTPSEDFESFTMYKYDYMIEKL